MTAYGTARRLREAVMAKGASMESAKTGRSTGRFGNLAGCQRTDKLLPGAFRSPAMERFSVAQKPEALPVTEPFFGWIRQWLPYASNRKAQQRQSAGPSAAHMITLKKLT